MKLETQKKLIAIDGNSLMHRAYYALPDMTTANGTPTGALHGFLSMLLRLISDKPDYLVVAFDMHGPTFRHETFGDYKAGRKATPDDLKEQFPILQQLLEEMGIAICQCPSYEADDILGTFARMTTKEDVFSLLVTGDRDALQLIDASTHVLLTKRGVTDTVEFDEAALKEKYGLSPNHMRDLKGLMGDSSDNIPGVPGVGEKTALKLLGEYGDLENVLAHAAQVKGKLGEKLLANVETARMSYALGTICTTAPIEMELADCAFDPEKLSNARPHLIQLELKSIAARLPGDGPATPEQVVADAPNAQVVAIDTLESLETVVESHLKAQALAVDLSEDITFAFDSDIVYRIEQGDDLFSNCMEPEKILKALAPLFIDPEKTVLVFDSKRLRHILQAQGMPLDAMVFDAMIADYLISAIRPAKSLADISQQRLGTGLLGAAALFPLKQQMLSQLESQGMHALYSDMEMPLTKVLFDMECRGFHVDEKILLELQSQLSERIDALAAEIYDKTGETFNILSPKQLGEVLFERLQLPTRRKTKSGFSTDADTLESLAALHPAVPLILEYRFITKLKSTFVDGLLAVRSHTDGRVRSSFNQCVTATGRISSTEPNLQNIPVRTPLGREIRKAFIPSEGCVLVGADYSQIELRLLAHISGDSGMIAAFNSGEDIHRMTASEVFGVPLEDVTSDMRSAAKAVNFGIVYGISDFGLAKNLGIPVGSAKEYIAKYFQRYPGVKAYLDESVRQGKEMGYAVTLFNRRRSLPELKSSNFNTRSFGERVAMNMPIQGAAADIIKLAMVHVTESLQTEGFQARLILQVHDELIFDTPVNEQNTVAELAKDCMEQVCKLSVPLVADVRIGNSWYDTK